jgi:1-phosphatidylinositol-3-phosphate 5-kinase
VTQLTFTDSKRILTEALSLDTRFLPSQSIMDYSLLLGVDQKRSEVVLGIVDAIGSYNLFKSFESRGKIALNRGGEVTIVGVSARSSHSRE